MPHSGGGQAAWDQDPEPELELGLGRDMGEDEGEGRITENDEEVVEALALVTGGGLDDGLYEVGV